MDPLAWGVTSFLLAHLGTAIWFGATIKARVDAAARQIERMADRFDSMADDFKAADRIAAAMEARLDGVEEAVRDLKRRAG